MILLVHSTKDVAGINIAKHIQKQRQLSKTDQAYQGNLIYTSEINGKKVFHVTLSSEAVYAQDLPKHFPDSQLIVFISRHSSHSGKPTLSVHTPGNLAAAELGGLPRQVSVASANAMYTALAELLHLKDQTSLEYEVSYECTHHGPSLLVPTMFVELGSSEKQWNDQVAAAVVAQAATRAIAFYDNSKVSAALGIGGTHYNQKFTKMALNEKTLFGHMIPKYAIPHIDDEILKQCVERNLEQVNSVVLDWKGIRSEDKPKLISSLEATGLKVMKV